MRLRDFRVALAFAAAAATVLAGCAQENASTGWERLAIALPAGPKVATTDSSATGLWVLAWDDTGSTEPPKLSHFVVGEGIVAEHPLPGPGSGIAVGAGLDLSPDGRIWAAWSDRLMVVDPDTGSVTEHRIPAAVTDRTDPAAGSAVDLAIAESGHILVAVTGTAELYRFDPASGDWSTVELGGLTIFDFSVIAPLDGGAVAVNGTFRQGATGHIWRTAVAGFGQVARIIEADSYQLASGSSTPVVLGHDGVVGRIGGPSGESLDRLDVSFEQVGAPCRFAQEPNGRTWFYRYGLGELFVVALEAMGGAAIEYEFPVLTLGGQNGGPRPSNPLGLDEDSTDGLALDPAIQQLLPDPAGGLWVLTRYSGDAGDAYSALYHFTP